jgi:hypothetical protein
MRKILWVSILAASFACGANAQKIDWQIFSEPFVTSAHAQEIDWQKVDAAFGRKPAVVAGDVHRYGFPRTDLTVTLDGVNIKPALALGGWIAFKPAHGGAMAMGDLVLLETEINPVMSKLLENGLEITAIHNHLLRSSPATFYIHVGGHGDPVKMAATIREALTASKTPLGGMEIAPVGPMGLVTPINFQPTGGGKAAITGDFVLTGDEVNPVIKALRENGIDVTAIHSHMLAEQPRLFFLHFWANDDALKLARGLRAALDKTASTKS